MLATADRARRIDHIRGSTADITAVAPPSPPAADRAVFRLDDTAHGPALRPG